MAQFIDTATERLDVQHPKYIDAVILERITAAADRGVKVHVLCGGKHGISEWDILDTFASLRTLKRFGVKVHKQKNLRVHAKLIIADNRHALVGSMNIDRSAFDLRRELGIMTDDPAIVGRLKEIFDGDWDASHHYEAPDPLDPSQHHEDDFPHDHDLMHEGGRCRSRQGLAPRTRVDVQSHRDRLVRRRAVGLVTRSACRREAVDG